MYDCILPVVSALCVSVLTGVWAGIWRKQKKLCRHYQAMNDGMRCLLRAELIRDHTHSLDKGYIPIYAMENVLESYTAYHALGGNGTITKMVEELKRFPTRKGCGEEPQKTYEHNLMERVTSEKGDMV